MLVCRRYISTSRNVLAKTSQMCDWSLREYVLSISPIVLSRIQFWRARTSLSICFYIQFNDHCLSYIYLIPNQPWTHAPNPFQYFGFQTYYVDIWSVERFPNNRIHFPSIFSSSSGLEYYKSIEYFLQNFSFE